MIIFICLIAIAADNVDSFHVLQWLQWDLHTYIQRLKSALLFFKYVCVWVMSSFISTLSFSLDLHIYFFKYNDVKHWTQCYFYSHRFPHFSNHIYRKTTNKQTNKHKNILYSFYFFSFLSIAHHHHRALCLLHVGCFVFGFVEFSPFIFHYEIWDVFYVVYVFIFLTLGSQFHTLFSIILPCTSFSI